MIKSTNLPFFRIIITAVLFFAIPSCIDSVNIVLQNNTISTTVVMHTVTLFLVILNYDVLEIHTERLKGKLGDFVLFTFIAAILVRLVFFFNSNWLHAPLPQLVKESYQGYTFFIPIILMAYSFSYTISFVITFKALTDRFKVQINEKLIIFFSGVLFGLFVSLSAFYLLSLTEFLTAFIFFFLISMITSYTYNQTHSIIPMAIGYGLVLFISLL